MNVFFAFASYGLSSYEWYLLAGLATLVSSGVYDPVTMKEDSVAI